MSLQLKLTHKDLAICDYDHNRPKAWRASAGKVITTMSCRHMIEGDWATDETVVDPYEELYRLAQSPADAVADSSGSEQPKDTRQGDASVVDRILRDKIQSRPPKLALDGQHAASMDVEQVSEQDPQWSAPGTPKQTHSGRAVLVAGHPASPAKAGAQWETTSTHSGSSASPFVAGGSLGEDYALRLLSTEVKSGGVFYRLLRGARIREPDSEREKRIILWKKLTHSLRSHKHLLDGVAELDVRSLWIRVCTSAQPNPRELMVTYLGALWKCDKSATQPFAAWHLKYMEVYKDLESVGCVLPDMLKLGLLFHFMKTDKRYERALEQCKENDWDYKACVSKFEQRANEIGNNTAAGKQTPQVVGAITQDAAAKKKEPCRRFKEGRCPNSAADCDYSHKVRKKKKGAGAPPRAAPAGSAQPNATPPPGAAKAVTTVETGKDGKPICFTYKATKTCSRAETCKFSHLLGAIGSVIPNHRTLKEADDSDGCIIEVGDTVGVSESNGLGPCYEPFGMQGRVTGLHSVVIDAKVVQFCAIDFNSESVSHEQQQLARSLSQGTPAKLLSVLAKAEGNMKKTREPQGEPAHTVARIAPASMRAIVDTGASIHQTSTKAYFADFDPDRSVSVQGANKSSVWSTEGEGTVLMHSNCQPGRVIPIRWRYVPDGPRSFFSFGHVEQRYGWGIRAQHGDMYILDEEGKDLFRCPLEYTDERLDSEGEPIPAPHIIPEEVFAPRRRHAVCAVTTRLQRAARLAARQNTSDERSAQASSCGATENPAEKDSEPGEPASAKSDAPGKSAAASGAAVIKKSATEGEILKVVRDVVRMHELHGHAHMDKVLCMMGIKDKRVRDAVTNLCVSCAIAKLTSKPVGKPILERATRRLWRVFIDCCGPFVESVGPGHYKHFLHIVDEATNYGEVIMLKRRADAVAALKAWIKQVCLRFGEKLVEIRLDGAPEFKSNELISWAANRGTKLSPGLPYAHHHQWKVERAHRTVQSGGRASRHRAGVPRTLWPYSIRAAREALNRVPASADVNKGKSGPLPIVEWNQPDDEAQYLRRTATNIRFGGACVALREKETRRKGDHPGEYCVYLGLSPSGGHTVLRWSDKKIRENVRTVKEIPNRFPFLDDKEGTEPVGVLGVGGDATARETREGDTPSKAPKPEQPFETEEEAKAEEPTLGAKHAYKAGDHVMTTAGPAIIDKVLKRDDVRVRWPGGEDPEALYTVAVKDVWRVEDYPHDNYDSHGNFVGAVGPAPAPVGPNRLLDNIPASEIDKMLPRTKKQERECPRELLEHVYEAKHLEWQSLQKEKCYSELMDLPDGKKANRHVWVLRAKSNAAGLLAKIKARCALDGSRDTVTPMEAYSPVAGAAAVRCLIATNINHPDVRFWELDVQGAYINADAKREIYAYPPDGFRPSETYHKVLRIKKALYGAADSGRLYYEHWNHIHTEMGFQGVHHDKCYLQLYVDENNFIRFVYHVDDGTYAQVGKELWEQYLEKLGKYLKYKVGPLSYCLGVQFHIDYEIGIVHMEQSAQVEKLLRTFGLDSDSVKPAPTPVLEGVEPNMKDAVEHSAKEQERGECFKMMAALGGLNHLHTCTRADIGKPLRVASKFGTKFGPSHVMYVKHVMRYLKGTKHMGLTYRRTGLGRGPGLLQVFTDASHASDVDTRRSVSGIVIKLSGNTVYWKVCFQSIVSHSSTESELMALDKGATLGQYIKWLCVSMGVVARKPIPIYVDNSATITISSNPVQPGRNLHVHARFFYIRDFVEEGEYEILHLRTDKQLSDVLVTHKSKHVFLSLRPMLMGCAYVHAVDGEHVWCEDYLWA